MLLEKKIYPMIFKAPTIMVFRIPFILSALCFLFFTSSQVAVAQDLTSEEAQAKVTHTIRLLERAYIDDVSYEDAAENAIKGMLKELDPHSVYISKEENKKMNEPLNGNFEGIGIQFNLLRDTILVVSVISGGPSEKLGILPGDQIIKIKGKNVAGIGFKTSDVIKALKGEKGTTVNIDIRRSSEKELIPFDIVRDKIPIHSVEAAYMATPTIGYIKVNRFAVNTVDEFEEALTKLKNKGMESLILDLKGNGGGYLKTAVDLTDQFLEKDRMITYTQGRAYPRQPYKSSSKGNFEKGKLVVLIDEGSASASEILSGAVQDWDRGLIIGRRSFGKGLVQKPFKLNDGSAIRLTIAHYYTPTGRSIQKPYDDGVDAYRKDIKERYTRGEMSDIDKVQIADSLQFSTLVKKRTVYGGGGIMPDIFIPVDTSFQTDYYKKLNRKGVFNQYILNYINENRSDLETTYSDEKTFIENYQVGIKMLDGFTTFAELEREIPLVEEDWTVSQPLIKTRLKALVGRYLFGISPYYQVMNEFNQAYLAGIKAINEDSFSQMNVGE